MANHFSAVKATRIIERRTAVNRMRRTRLRHTIREMRKALETKDLDKAKTLLSGTFSIVDRAAKWGVIKKGTAARYKSRLHLRLKKLETPA